ncbi:MAG: nucleotidyltransferase family protein [Pseudomonadota bacterium]
MSQESLIADWLRLDPWRMDALRLAASLKLNDWCLAAGFVRNLVWDKVHSYAVSTPLNDINLIYFDPVRDSSDSDKAIESELRAISTLPWSVKNQARMHLRNDDAPYFSTEHAMKHWVELETAIGARISSSGDLELVAPFGVAGLFDSTITINPNRRKTADFTHRIKSKRWLELGPSLEIIDA